MPEPKVAVDEQVVHEEDGVRGGRRHVGHDGADAVVAVGVRAQLGAVLHVRVRRARVARVDKVSVGLRRQRLVHSPRQAVVRVARAGPNVADVVGKGLESLRLAATFVYRGPVNITYTIGDAGTLAIGGTRQASEEVGCEHGGAGKVTSIQGLIPPREGPVKATLVPHDLLEGPHVVAVPEEEDVVSVDGAGHCLVHTDDILPAVLGGGVVARGRGVHQTLDGVDKGVSVRVRVVPPLEADVGVGTRCRGGLDSVDLGEGFRLSGLRVGALALAGCHAQGVGNGVGHAREVVCDLADDLGETAVVRLDNARLGILERQGLEPSKLVQVEGISIQSTLVGGGLRQRERRDDGTAQGVRCYC